VDIDGPVFDEHLSTQGGTGGNQELVVLVVPEELFVADAHREGEEVHFRDRPEENPPCPLAEG